MIASPYIAGIDGGASKTVALVADRNGKILGRGRAGPSNYHNIGAEAASAAIKSALKRAKDDAGIREKPEIAVVALAAVDSEQDMRVASHFVKNTKIARTSIVVHDSVAALFAVTKGSPGIVVNSGTGSFAAGINSKGEYARAGGWGYIVGDEGSGYDIGLRAIKMAFRSFDGREKTTELIGMLNQRFHIKSVDDLVSQIYGNGLTVEQIAAVAPLVIRAARNDRISKAIINDAGVELGELACAVASRLKMTRQEFPVAVVGGNFRSGADLLRSLKSKIKKCSPNARIIRPHVEPALGSLSIALETLSRKTNKSEASKVLICSS
ncbi:MAG: BadF/BadG/BcrA/BcrD ATPase family protein [Candidatus Bathyarchaeia archaeon]